MIDLRSKTLPDSITLESGRVFKIKTDFRVWIEFGEVIKKEHCTMKDLLFVFEDDLPCEDFYCELMKFYANPNSTPASSGSSSDDDIVDMIEDGEYIYASFIKDYGIDLLTVDMHWHVFKALFGSLSEDTKMSKIMSMRGYRKSNKTIDEQYSELKRVWQLPTKISEDDIKLLEYFNSL